MGKERPQVPPPFRHPDSSETNVQWYKREHRAFGENVFFEKHIQSQKWQPYCHPMGNSEGTEGSRPSAEKSQHRLARRLFAGHVALGKPGLGFRPDHSIVISQVPQGLSEGNTWVCRSDPGDPFFLPLAELLQRHKRETLAGLFLVLQCVNSSQECPFCDLDLAGVSQEVQEVNAEAEVVLRAMCAQPLVDPSQSLGRLAFDNILWTRWAKRLVDAYHVLKPAASGIENGLFCIPVGCFSVDAGTSLASTLCGTLPLQARGEYPLGAG